jgi:dolichol-phosphate mannosyltransferase
MSEPAQHRSDTARARSIHGTGAGSMITRNGCGADTTERPVLSLVVPAYNEQESLPRLYERVVEALGSALQWELVLVDDGSEDHTFHVMSELEKKDPRVRALRLLANAGQTAATSVGLQSARGNLIATLDADLQNDPIDLLPMLEALGENDAVVGYRVGRRDDWVRRMSSRIANGVRNRLSGDQIRDTGCSLKLFRAEAISSIPLFEGMHRFLPTLLRFHGYRVIEVPVSHHERLAGESKYGIRNRAWVAFKDLLAVRWMRSRIIRAQVDVRPDRESAE